MSTRQIYLALIVAASIVIASCSSAEPVDVEPSAAEPTETAATTEPEQPTPVQVIEVPAEPHEPGELTAEREAEIRAELDEYHSAEETDFVVAALGNSQQAAAAFTLDRDLYREDDAAVIFIAETLLDCVPDTYPGYVRIGAFVPADDDTCQHEILTSGIDNRYDLMWGINTFDTDRPVPNASRESLVDLLTTCHDTLYFRTSYLGWLYGDENVANFADRSCLDEALTPEIVRPMYETLVSDPDAVREDVEYDAMLDLLNASFPCLDLNRLIASRAQVNNVKLSDETIACIDSAVTVAAFTEAFDPQRDGEPVDDIVIVADSTGCLTSV